MKISIHEPCNESWDKMTDAGDKKICSSCTKFVHDFTSYSDEMLIDFFKKSGNENSCGRFRLNQLDRKIVFQKRIKSRFNYFWAALIGIFAFIKNSYSQNTTLKNECGIEMKITQKEKSPETKTGKIFAGLLLEKGTNNSISNCKITIEGMDSVFRSDKSGLFEIDLPESFGKKKFSAKFEAEYFYSDSVEVDFGKFERRDLMLELKPDGKIKITRECYSMGLTVIIAEPIKSARDIFNEQRGTSFNTVKEFFQMLREWYH